jgi:molybdopterin converting factor small subunit
LKVRVQYFGYIKNILNKKEECYELDDGACLSDLLNKMSGIHGAPFQKDVYEPGLKDLKMGFSVTVNGVLMGQLNGIDTQLADGDNIILMSLMSGG